MLPDDGLPIMPTDDFVSYVETYATIIKTRGLSDLYVYELRNFTYLVNWGYLTNEGDYDTEYYILKELQDGS